MSLLPPSWTNTVSLFRPQESLTRPVNRHTSLVGSLPAALSSFLSHRDSHSHAHAHTYTPPSHTHQHTKAQTNPSAIFNYATQLALPLPSFVILYLLVCLPACSLSSSVVSAVFPSFLFFCSSVQLFPRSPHQPLARTYRVMITLLSLIFFSHRLALERLPFPLLSFMLYNSLSVPTTPLSWCGPFFFSCCPPPLHFQSFLIHVFLPHKYLGQCIC